MTQKNAPAAVGAADEGENTSPPNEEQNMNTPIIADVREEVQRIFKELAECLEGQFVILEPSDALYQEPRPVRLKPVSEFGGKFRIGDLIDLAPVFDENGVRVEEPGSEWWASAFAEVGMTGWYRWMRTPNGVIRVGDRLVVAVGSYQVVGTRVVDGVEVAELITLEEHNRRQREAQEAWTESHLRLILASMPVGATSYEVWDFVSTDETVGVLFKHDVGRVTISWGADVKDGRVTRMAETPTVSVEAGNQMIEMSGVQEMREVASALMAAIPVLEAAQVHP